MAAAITGTGGEQVAISVIPNNDDLVEIVTPVKTGVQYFRNTFKFLDSGVHRNDNFGAFSTFEESINKYCYLAERVISRVISIAFCGLR